MALIAGVDEAGRGPLAGPVVAAAVILPREFDLPGLNDSKKISPGKREKLFKAIQEQAVSIGIGSIDASTIDKLNILQATYRAMQMALGRLTVYPERALIDGSELPNQVIPNEGVIKGDESVPSIQAASIIAKVTRDREMLEYHTIFPEYGFDKHKGYGTRFHLDALEDWKASPIHRQSFKPVAHERMSLAWYQSSRRIGWLGEKLAALHLRDRGYRIHAMNVRVAPHGEIDIVAEKEGTRVFVEVKTARQSPTQTGSPDERIDAQKLLRLEHAIDQYCMETDWDGPIRLDGISVLMRKGGKSIHHYRGIDISGEIDAIPD